MVRRTCRAGDEPRSLKSFMKRKVKVQGCGDWRPYQRETRRNRSHCREDGARNVRLFGSVVRGEADDKSDVDLLVTLDENTTLLNHAALIEDLEELLGRKVDVASDRGLRPRIKDRVLSEAVTL